MSEDDDTTTSNPFTQPRFVLAAIFMLGLVVMLVWLLAFNRSDADEDTTEETPTPSEAPTDTAGPESPTEETPSNGDAASEPSWCGLETVELEGTLTRAPADTTWDHVGTMATPNVEGHGPAVVDDVNFRHCFARTPTGATLAAVQYIASDTDPRLAGLRAEHLLVEGPVRDNALAEAEGGSAEERSTLRINLEGFRLLEYDGHDALVDLLVSNNESDELISMTIPLEWVEGDWRVAIRTEEDVTGRYTTVPSSSGYVIWRAP